MSIQQRFSRLPFLLGVKNKRQFATELGFTPQHIGNIMNGKKGIGLEVVEAVITKFPVNPYWLILGKGDPLVSSEDHKEMTSDKYDRLSAEVAELRNMMEELRKKDK